MLQLRLILVYCSACINQGVLLLIVNPMLILVPRRFGYQFISIFSHIFLFIYYFFNYLINYILYYTSKYHNSSDDLYTRTTLGNIFSAVVNSSSELIRFIELFMRFTSIGSLDKPPLPPPPPPPPPPLLSSLAIVVVAGPPVGRSETSSATYVDMRAFASVGENSSGSTCREEWYHVDETSSATYVVELCAYTNVSETSSATYTVGVRS